MPFLLDDASNLIYMNGSAITISDWLVSLQEKLKPDVEPIKYYKRVSTPTVGKPDNFTLERTHIVCYSLADIAESDKGIQASNVGSCLPWPTWNTKATRILWTLRTAAKGALPVRPYIVTSTAILVPAQHYVILA